MIIAERMLELLRLNPEKPIDFIEHAEDMGIGGYGGGNDTGNRLLSIRVHICKARKHLEANEKIVALGSDDRHKFRGVYMLQILS